MNSRGRLKRDPGPQDLLSVAKNCLDLLMRPDEERRPGRYASAAAARGGRHHKGRREKEKEERRKCPRRCTTSWSSGPEICPVTVGLELLGFG